MTYETLIALSERCEAATGPDVNIDCDIARSFGPAKVSQRPFTASIDAAMTLVPEGPNNGGYRLNRDDDLRTKFIAEIWEHPDAEPGDGWHRARGASMPLALCAAALRARASMEKQP